MMHTSRRLTQVLRLSSEINFDDTSKFIFFSDVHRGDNSWADDFARNQNLFFYALSYYYDQKFTYIEIGDGDELWKNRDFSTIREAHSDVFWLLQKYHEENRFYMIWGNHDVVKKDRRFIAKNLRSYYNRRSCHRGPLFEDIQVHEGLVLKYAGTPHKILVTHGHQGDFINDRLWPIARFLVRYLWRQLELHGFKDLTSPAKNYTKINVIERNIIHWVKENSQMIIAGHTHRPMFPAVGNPLYFNTGSCVHPRCITGIEIQKGTIALIKWSIKTNANGTLFVTKDFIAGPEKLIDLFTGNNEENR